MLQKTKGIVLRSVKYGETSLITTIFTEHFGVETYMIKGVRTQKTTTNKAGLLQPATLLELVVYHQPQKALQYLREFHTAILYTTIQQHVVKNAVALFSIELLLRLLPEHAPQPDLFNFVSDYFTHLDRSPHTALGNYPLYFIITCSHRLGYELKGNYTTDTPHINLVEGGYTAHPPPSPPYLTDRDAPVLDKLLQASDWDDFATIEMNAAIRSSILEWYIIFLQQHSQHMGAMRSLSILQTVLHE